MNLHGLYFYGEKKCLALEHSCVFEPTDSSFYS
jgi:hypothetical protein